MKQETVEEYIRQISKLDSGNGVRSTDLANVLSRSKNTVSIMLYKLMEEGFVHMKKYGKITLTNKGINMAKKMNFKHRIIETFLYSKLGINEKRIHVEACQLEHAMSDEVAEKLFEFLGKPSKDPHGKEIL